MLPIAAAKRVETMSAVQKTAFAFVVAVACWSNASMAQHPGTGVGYESGKHHHRGGYRVQYHGHASPHGHWAYRPNYANYGYNGHEVADVIRSRGQANLLNAQARTQNEIARSAALDNDVKELATYHERRQINRTTRFGHLHARGEQLRASKAQAEHEAQLAGFRIEDVAGLTPDELDPVTGQLAWPLLLQGTHYNRARQPVDIIFATRAQAGQVNPDHYLPLRDWIDRVDYELDCYVHLYPKADYAKAKDFLRRLMIEARLPALQLSSPTQLASH
ncbi:MAG: hypothetical protein HKN47_23105 [Pirellulaceae bacterium]|nr:hypothetical protein [Pirellulaceae bacterium]